MTTPAIGDSSDKVIEMSKAKRIGGWYVDRSLVPDDPVSQAMPTWIEFVTRNPDATLPNGVGGAIVAFFERNVVTLSNELTRTAQASGAPDPFAIAEHVLGKMIELAQSQEIAKKYEDRYFSTKVPSPAFEAAIEWHKRGLAVSPSAPSGQHVAAILDHFGYTP